MQLTDVTLREGGQLPGRSYSADQKVAAGLKLDQLGVSSIQVGFPVTGQRDVTATRRLAGQTDAAVEGIARALPGDIDAIVDADADRVDVFAPLSPAHLDTVMQTSYPEMLDQLEVAIDHARDHGLPMTLTLMDGFRTDPARLIEAFERFEYPEHLGIADTVGSETPREVRRTLDTLSTAGVDLTRVGVHFHEDLGLATANTLAAGRAGVGKADVSVASLGERAGNAALEEVAVSDIITDGNLVETASSDIIPVCEAALAILDEKIDPRKPILGADVTRHEAGIHTAAMLDEPRVFEPFDPATFGGRRELVFGEGTGRGGARKLLEQADTDPSDDNITQLLDRLARDGPVDHAEARAIAERLGQWES